MTQLPMHPVTYQPLLIIAYVHHVAAIVVSTWDLCPFMCVHFVRLARCPFMIFKSILPPKMK